jgi:hypothetical protein
MLKIWSFIQNRDESPELEFPLNLTLELMGHHRIKIQHKSLVLKKQVNKKTEHQMYLNSLLVQLMHTNYIRLLNY